MPAIRAPARRQPTPTPAAAAGRIPWLCAELLEVLKADDETEDVATVLVLAADPGCDVLMEYEELLSEELELLGPGVFEVDVPADCV